MKIDIALKDLKTLQALLKQYLPHTLVWAFGSRVKFTAKPNSDLDLVAFISPEQEMKLSMLKDALQNSDIPFRIDLHNWNELPDTFHQNIVSDYVEIQSDTKPKQPKGWKTYRLGDFVEINPRVPLKQGNEYSFVEMKDLDATQKYVSPSAKRELKGGSKFQNGDTLFARITPCLENGKICQVKNLENNVGFGSTEFLIFRGKENVSDNDFVYYLSRSEFVKNNAIQMMTGTSGRQRVEKSALEQLEIQAPDLPTQRQIAQILTSLDDKIELNLQMNQTLEAMAQAIFKEWFVNFNFPSSELGLDGLKDDRILDEEKKKKEILKSFNPKNHNSDNGLPKGWRMEPIDANIEFLNGLALQKYPPVNEDEYLPVIKIRELRQGVTNSSDKASTQIPEKYIIENGDILFSWSGSLEVVMWCNGQGALNQHLFKVSSEKYPKWFYYYWIKHFLPIYQSIAADKTTTMGHIQRRHLTESIINVPDLETFNEANKVLEPILEKIKYNTLQIQTLTQTRDTLLPKLMSGSLNYDF